MQFTEPATVTKVFHLLFQSACLFCYFADAFVTYMLELNTLRHPWLFFSVRLYKVVGLITNVFVRMLTVEKDKD